MARSDGDDARAVGPDRAGPATAPVTSKAARRPAGLIGAIALIVLLDGLIARIPIGPDRRDRLEASWDSAWRESNGPGARAEILCLGDSQIKLGIQPRILEARLGRSVYNLAVLGGPPPTGHELLRRVLESGPAPRALIVSFSPLILGMDPRDNLEWWAGRIPWGDRLGLISGLRKPGLVASLVLHGLSPSLSCRDAWRRAMGLATPPKAGGDRGPAPDEESVLARNWSRNRGAQVAPRAYIPIQGALARPYEGADWKWAAHPIHAYFAERFLSAARDRAIPVYWVIPPADAGWLDRNARVGTIGAYRRYVRDLLERFPGLTVLDLQEAGWDRSWFRDPIHLNRDGAIRLSLAVAEALSRPESGPAPVARWVKLDGGPVGPLRPYQDLLEDLDQSRLAVRQGVSGPITMEGPIR